MIGLWTGINAVVVHRMLDVPSQYESAVPSDASLTDVPAAAIRW
jgi:hypothetical protein